MNWCSTENSQNFNRTLDGRCHAKAASVQRLLRHGTALCSSCCEPRRRRNCGSRASCVLHAVSFSPPPPSSSSKDWRERRKREKKTSQAFGYRSCQDAPRAIARAQAQEIWKLMIALHMHNAKQLWGFFLYMCCQCFVVCSLEFLTARVWLGIGSTN